jgi:hypothetical protein
LRATAASAKAHYDAAVLRRSEVQSQVNSLLERKQLWTNEDVSRFTDLVRTDHASTMDVSMMSERLKELDTDADRAFSELLQSIYRRYHEEQIWSDKIRSLASYASFIGLVVNLIVFVGAITVVEPWKRRRLVEGLEQRMNQSIEGLQLDIRSLMDTSTADRTISKAGPLLVPAAAAKGPEVEVSRTEQILKFIEVPWPPFAVAANGLLVIVVFLVLVRQMH